MLSVVNLPQKVFIFQWMLLSMNMNLISPFLQEKNSTIKNKDNGDLKDFFLFDMPSFCKHVLENVRFGKVHSRKKEAIPESMKFQDSNSDPNNEVTIF